MGEGVDRLRGVGDRIRAILEAERQRIGAEIRSYPTPIPRCDQQFNQLIDRRELLFQELSRLDAAAASAAAAADTVEAWYACIDSSACLDNETKLSLKAALRDGSDKPERLLGTESDPQSQPGAAAAGR